MRQSKLLTKTAKESPKDEVSINSSLLIRAGFIDKSSAGVYTFLPLGLLALNKIKEIIREEMNNLGAQEILMPALTPKENWVKTGRWDKVDILYKLKGAGDKEFALGATHEEVVTPLVQRFATSYKDLPTAVYQIQDKFRNEPRAKSGLLRGREFSMKDLYSFHANENDLDEYYAKAQIAYKKIFERLGLDAKIVEASGGSFSKYSHEYQVITEYGEDTVFYCPKCRRYQNKEIAEGQPDIKSEDSEPLKDLEQVKAERSNSVKASMELMNIGAHQILKNIVYQTKNGLVGVSIRGDLEVNEVKLQAHLEDYTVCAASEEELKKAGLVEGFISPVENDKIKWLGDLSIQTVKNFVTGANAINQDLINVNYPRDFAVSELADLSVIKPGFTCKDCEGELSELKTIEVGNIFKLMTKFSESFGYKYLDQDGKLKPVLMGCYGIGPSRILGTIVEVFHDDKGIIWPTAVAPFTVHLLVLGEDEAILNRAEKLYQKLQKDGISVLFDDRTVSAGQKFADADLIGLPYRLVISAKTKTKVEIKARMQDQAKLVPAITVLNLIKKQLKKSS